MLPSRNNISWFILHVEGACNDMPLCVCVCGVTVGGGKEWGPQIQVFGYLIFMTDWGWGGIIRALDQCEEGPPASQKIREKTVTQTYKRCPPCPKAHRDGIRLPFQFTSGGQVRPRGSLGWALINAILCHRGTLSHPQLSWREQLPRNWCEPRLFLSHKPPSSGVERL